MRRIFVATVLLLAVVFAIWRIRLYYRVNAQLSAIRAAGLPSLPAELNYWLPVVPDSENGALILTQAFTQLHEFPASRSNTFSDLILHNRQTWSPERRSLAEAYVQTNREALLQIEAAVHHPSFRYPVDYSYGASTLLPHLAKLKASAQILRFQTVLQSEESSTAWTNSVLLQLKLAETLNSDPTVIGYLVRVAILGIAGQSAEYALNRSVPEPGICNLLQAAFLRAAQTNLLSQALIGERAMFIPYFRLSRADMNALRADDDVDRPASVPIKPSGKAFRPLWITGFFERDLSFYLATMDKGIAISRTQAPANLELTNVFNVGDLIHRRFYVMSGMVLPALSKVALKAATGEASANLAATAFAVESYRATHHELPKTLANLIPESVDKIPQDPFDGHALRYRRLERGYLFYSIDADGKDDGEKESPVKKKFKDPNTYDMTFSVER